LVRPIISKFLAQIMPQRSPARVLIITILTGALIGILVCISSVGAGAIGMTILILLYPDIKLEKLVGADIAHAVPLTLIAGAGHWLIGDVNSHLLLTLLIGSIPGITIGSLLITKIPAAALRTILAIILLIVGTRLLT
ncbi:MAG TPA: sulfite exporter TauE/SafE family protein, partial [Acetobacteraceae bacterium]|nr:sulfite exporter TauE/SafE family protein [Acetobacteraceae bacterium]